MKTSQIPFLILAIVISQLVDANAILEGKRCIYTKTKPTPKTQTFKLIDDQGSGACIMASFAAYYQFFGVYMELNDGSIRDTSSCCRNDHDECYLAVEYDCGDVIFWFGRDQRSMKVNMVAGETIAYEFVDNTTGSWMHTQHPDHAYRCDSEQAISVHLMISNVHLEPYRDPQKPDFYQPEDRCPLDSIFKYD